jgi:hypothetical protein
VTVIRAPFFVVLACAVAGGCAGPPPRPISPTGTRAGSAGDLVLAAVGVASDAIRRTASRSRGAPRETNVAPLSARHRCVTASGASDHVVAPTPARATAVCEELNGEPCSCEIAEEPGRVGG